MPFTLPPLPYAMDALQPFIDAKTMEIHHGKHHATYISNLNQALQSHPEFAALDIYTLLARLSQLPDTLRAAVRNNGGGHLNHSFFWGILGTPRNSGPLGDLSLALNTAFGNFDNFKAEFARIGLARFGSGWVWLTVSPNGHLGLASTPNQDSPWMGKEVSGIEGIPILGLDVWEHAYYLQYQNRRADYITAFWNVVRWDVVEAQYFSAIA